jgi:hypothetical protein
MDQRARMKNFSLGLSLAVLQGIVYDARPHCARRGTFLAGSLVRLGEVSYGGLWLACGTALDFLFRALKWRGCLRPKHEFRKELFMNNDRFGNA